MAELHVQKKEANIWPWIIGALVLAIVLWFAFGRADTTNTATTSTSADSAYQTAPASSTPGNPTP